MSHQASAVKRGRTVARRRRGRSDASAESSRDRILRGATEEFAQAGFAGARIDRIARKTTFNVRMIYYHFGSKRGLYRAVLEGIYEQAARLLDTSERDENPATAALGLYFDLLNGTLGDGSQFLSCWRVSN